MTPAPSSPAPPPAKGSGLTLAMLALVLALQLAMVFQRAINEDEFFHYSQVHRLVAGALAEPLQTLYTRAFAWVTVLPGDGIDHIVVIRLFMLGCEAVTLACLFGVATRFASRQAAWLAVLSYAGGGYVFQHAASFRFDSPAAALLMLAALALLRARLNWSAIAAIGLLLGTATVLTIKAVLYAPVFAGIAWLRWTEAGRSSAMLVRLGAIALAAAAAFALVYALHASTLGAAADGEARAVVSRAGSKMFGLGLPPYWQHHLKGMAIAPLVTLLALCFPIVLRGDVRPAAEKAALAGLFLPLATLLFYHNTAPYYFVFMLAPVCAALAIVLDRALPRYGAARIALLLGGLALALWAVEDRAIIQRQRALVNAGERLLPQHPAYFDGFAMLGAMPKANVFMTPWGTEQYLKGQESSLSDTLAARPVPLVLENKDAFTAALRSRQPVGDFLPQDLALLRRVYVNLWGPLWLAGFDVPAGDSMTITVEVPGPYTLHAAQPVTVDGIARAPGTVFELTRGPHTIAPRTAPLRLLWGDRIKAPATPPPAPPYLLPY